MWRGLSLPLIFFGLRCLNVYIRKQMYGDYAVKPSYISFKCFNYSTTKFVNKENFCSKQIKIVFMKAELNHLLHVFRFSCVYLSDICNYTEHLSFSIHWQFQVQGPTMVPPYWIWHHLYILLYQTALHEKRGIFYYLYKNNLFIGIWKYLNVLPNIFLIYFVDDVWVLCGKISSIITRKGWKSHEYLNWAIKIIVKWTWKWCYDLSEWFEY